MVYSDLPVRSAGAIHTPQVSQLECMTLASLFRFLTWVTFADFIALGHRPS